MLTIIKDKKYTLGWRASCRFVISLNKKDLKILNGFKDFFGAGTISFMGENAVQYRVESLKDLAIIINHFDKYPLITVWTPLSLFVSSVCFFFLYKKKKLYKKK
jgi:hypothetical protein